MAEGTLQKITIALFVGLFFVMYLGCETTSKEMQVLEKSRTLEPVYLNIEQEINQAQRLISEKDRLEIENHLVNIEQSSADSTKIESLKKLAGKWYNLSMPLFSAYYAEQIAELENTEEAWGIAGTTNYLGLSTATEENQKKYARQKAIAAFEKAISLNPDNIDHKINSALCYVEYADEDQPMKGIMMLLDLDKSNPEEPAVQMQLGRLSIKTNQWDKALNRFNKVLTMEPNNKEVHCYLSQVYEAKNDMVNAAKSAEICQTR